ncbi:DUF5710 domain-containing protein [Pseudonocardia endophytica]|uniref:DUF5710 domain-containing protein n=1 Tax=Pseudonocardia endophytica TaxID=401976 RepID=A0A4R1HSS3_PSEEN|nr:DUF5710 domain-containing protein [Pseudonocardia endophytica]TCK25228.1 hypothetical protein EV378_1028 [Pseudonocardia endophytica]
MGQPSSSTATTRADRIWLDVPYAEKDAAKAVGARWDPHARRWYDPRPATPELQQWAARPELPDLLPGEDRTYKPGLFVDLIPTTSWFTNVRSCVAPRDWDRVRWMVTRRAGRTCEACGAAENRAEQRWLEAHERWAYDAKHSVQSLRRLVCLCTDCHRTTHYGLAEIHGTADQAFHHLMAVNGLSAAQAKSHISDAVDLWHARSLREWFLDLTVLTRQGIELVPPR